jgi:hypothetical protein
VKVADTRSVVRLAAAMGVAGPWQRIWPWWRLLFHTWCCCRLGRGIQHGDVGLHCADAMANAEGGQGGQGEVSRQDPSGINLFSLGGGQYRVDTAGGLVYGAPNYLESKTNAINSIILHYNNVLEQNTRAKHVI